MIVLDATVLIAYLDASDAHHARAEALLAREIDEEFAANPLTLAEVLVGPAGADRLEAATTALEELEVRELPFPADTAVRLARLRAETTTKMPDCCVLLAAETHGARLATFDENLRRTASARSIQIVEG